MGYFCEHSIKKSDWLLQEFNLKMCDCVSDFILLHQIVQPKSQNTTSDFVTKTKHAPLHANDLH